jgi:hypothetical protein
MAPSTGSTISHRDLYAPEVSPVPNRFEQGITEARIENILHRLFAQEVVDTKVDAGS